MQMQCVTQKRKDNETSYSYPEPMCPMIYLRIGHRSNLKFVTRHVACGFHDSGMSCLF